MIPSMESPDESPHERAGSLARPRHLDADVTYDTRVTARRNIAHTM